MPLYNETTTTTTSSQTTYEYSYFVEAQHPLNGVPKVAYKTAMVTRDNDTGEETMGNFHRVLEKTYTGNEVFDLLNPEDGSVIGQTTTDAFLAHVYSYFFHVAAQEDSGA